MIILLLIFFCLVVLYLLYFGEVIPSNDKIDVSLNHFSKFTSIESLTIANVIDVMRTSSTSCAIQQDPIFYGQEKAKKVIIYIHGFNSNIYEARSFLEKLSQQNEFKDYYIGALNLPGAGCLNEESSFLNVDVYTHLRFLSIVFNTIRDREIHLISSSTGCSYAIWVVSTLMENLKLNIVSNIMFSPNIEPYGFNSFLTKLAVLPFGNKIMNLAKYRYVPSDGYQDITMLNYMVGILEINRKNEGIYLSQTPILIFYTTQDNVVNYRRILHFYNAYTGPKVLQSIDTPYHNMITRSNLHDNFIKNIIDYMTDLNI